MSEDFLYQQVIKNTIHKWCKFETKSKYSFFKDDMIMYFENPKDSELILSQLKIFQILARYK